MQSFCRQMDDCISILELNYPTFFFFFNIFFLELISLTWCLSVNSPLDLYHVILGCGVPVTLHLMVPLVPSAIVVLSGVTDAFGTVAVQNRKD